MNFKDVLLRAFKTFWQAAVSYIIMNIANLNPFDGSANKKVWLGFAAAALAAGCSAAWNGVLKPLWDKLMSPDIS